MKKSILVFIFMLINGAWAVTSDEFVNRFTSKIKESTSMMDVYDLSEEYIVSKVKNKNLINMTKDNLTFMIERQNDNVIKTGVFYTIATGIKEKKNLIDLVVISLYLTSLKPNEEHEGKLYNMIKQMLIPVATEGVPVQFNIDGIKYIVSFPDDDTYLITAEIE